MPKNDTLQELIDSLIEEQRVVAQTQDEDQLLSPASRFIPESEPVERKDQSSASESLPISPEQQESSEIPQQEAVEENPQQDVSRSEFSISDQEPVPESPGGDQEPERIGIDRRTGESSPDGVSGGVGGSVDLAPGDEPDLPESGNFSEMDSGPTPIGPGEFEVDPANIPESVGEAADPQVDAMPQVEAESFTPENNDWVSVAEDFRVDQGDMPPGSGEFEPQDSGFSTGRDVLADELPEPFQSMVVQFGEKLDSVREQLSEMVSEQIARFGSQVYADATSSVNDEMEELKLLMDRRHSQ